MRTKRDRPGGVGGRSGTSTTWSRALLTTCSVLVVSRFCLAVSLLRGRLSAAQRVRQKARKGVPNKTNRSCRMLRGQVHPCDRKSKGAEATQGSRLAKWTRRTLRLKKSLSSSGSGGRASLHRSTHRFPCLPAGPGVHASNPLRHVCRATQR